ncbi:phage associated protein [Neisseria mucosa]|uniref:Rha family transcriptional regulator n=1 Tax=Neisseria mucosa TaxID=488 RepID=UPI000DFEBCB3|nr:Rha family transcriptional regulator [Neisseria mucosa]SUA94160.1 phage associated protein [Neisseria mucosa]
MTTQTLVRISGDRLVTTSLEISNHFGKKHKDILRAIQHLECSKEFNERNFAPVGYTDAKGEQRPMYEITRDGFVFLCMGFTGSAAAQWKEKYIAAFNALEAEVARRTRRH